MMRGSDTGAAVRAGAGALISTSSAPAAVTPKAAKIPTTRTIALRMSL
jgi:hypothetical protein